LTNKKGEIVYLNMQGAEGNLKVTGKRQLKEAWKYKQEDKSMK